MPKLLKMLRGRKTSSAVDLAKKRTSKSNGIFRRRDSQRSGKQVSKDIEDPISITIAPTITFTLSEDEVGGDIIHSPVSDIENQVQELFDEGDEDPMQTIEISAKANTKDIAVSTENDKTMTFTHLEIMRNELAHMMQLAEKDEEILTLRETNENLQASHNEIIKAKNDEIAKIREMLASIEAALFDARGELESMNKEHSKVIEVLMKTQYELYELKHRSPSSWMSPLWSFFDMN
ncbi:hypothetical protein IV203_017026 [Nitzschia inconspicua]|uniref:Uncharacterized protein n=1 Tax=Nitzschia inconspicua TaxID=303405 RepID=A0A9K3KRJ7_9STRA|nr:hypothetical protein IV203_017026 [Nitzschia inconspicua]